MSLQTLTASVSYSIALIKDEVRQLVNRGAIARHQPISTLREYIPAREWMGVELELEKNEFLLRDRLGDLIGREDWIND